MFGVHGEGPIRPIWNFLMRLIPSVGAEWRHPCAALVVTKTLLDQMAFFQGSCEQCRHTNSEM
jgi:hypothetical protein